MTHTPSLLDSIRRTIEERNLFSARSRINYISALKRANNNKCGSGNGSNNLKSPINSAPSVEARMVRLRNKVIQEIIKSEEVYVQHLHTIRDEFMEETEIKVSFSRRDFSAIFSNITVLLEVNEKLLDELKKSPSANNVSAVAEAFLNYAPYLKLYSTYASGFQQGHNLLVATLSQNPHLRSLIKEKEEKLNNTLQSYLITPIQRIPRYKLLLQQLVGFMRNGDRKEPNLQSLIDSIKKLDQVAHHMNEMIRQHENSCKLIDLNGWMGKNYHGDLVQPGRYFIKCGTVFKPTLSGSSVLPQNHFYLILLSDQVIACKIKSELGTKGCLQPNLVLPLKKCSITLVKDQHAEIKCEGESLKFTIVDLDDLQEWILIINESIKNLKRRSATLKKDSSNAKPLKREQIKDILRNKKRGVKRPAETESPAPTPGKLRKFLNISGRLDEIAEYLSPSVPSKKKSSLRPFSSTSMKENNNNAALDSAEQNQNQQQPQADMLMPLTQYPRSTCSIL